MRNWELDRRDLLKSLGIGAACLPLLSASKSWGQADKDKYKRLLIIHATAGYWMANWRPQDGSLMGQTLPSSCAPLEPHKSDLVFLHSMTNPEYKVGSNWGHECYGTIYWGGAQKAPGGSKYQEPNGPTLDQWVADKLPRNTGGRLTLNLQDGVDRQPRSGTTGSIRCFWRGAGQPINPEMNPAKTYADLFAGMGPSPAPTPGGGNMGGGPDPAVGKLLAQRKSLLDYVGTSLERFKVRVGKDDKQVIEGHLTSIRELEAEISGVGMGGGGGGIGPMGPINAMDPGPYTDQQIMADAALFPKIMDSYMDMMIVALRAGITRVATLQLANSSGNSLNFGAFVPGIPARGTGYKSAFRNWHDLGHNPSLGGTNHKVIVDKWCMEKFAGFIAKMKSIQEPGSPGGNMLNNSIVLWGNHMESGDNHGSQKIPWILAGKGSTNVLKSGTCTGSGKTISSAMADICKALELPAQPHWTGSAGAT
jgi:hypothetical protein